MSPTYPHVVIFVPGIAGSTLRREGRSIWTGNPLTLLRSVAGTAGVPFPGVDSLALAGDGKTVEDVTATGVLRRAGLLPGLAGVDFYGRFVDRLVATLRLRKDHNFFAFPYDWRLDNRVTSGILTEQATRWLHAWRAGGGPPDARLVFVAHSMGGLVARHAVEVRGLRDIVAAVITIGTPHRGAPKAARVLSGSSTYLRALSGLVTQLRRMPSIYQLLPVFPCLVGSDRVHRLTDQAVAHGLDRSLVADGACFLREIESAAGGSDPGRRPLLHAVVGVDQPTVTLLRQEHGGAGLVSHESAHDDAPAVQPNFAVPDLRGDGTVPEPSAYPIEWDDRHSAIWVSGRHTSLPGIRSTADQVIGLLSAAATTGQLARYRDVTRAGVPLTLDVPEVVEAEKPVEISVTPPRQNLLGIDLTVDRADGQSPERVAQHADPPAGKLMLDGLPPGLYRVSASQRHDPGQAVSDLLLVMPPD